MPTLQNALLEYQGKLEGLQSGLVQVQAKQYGALALLWALLAFFLLLCFAAYSSRRALPAWLSPLVVPIAALPLRRLFASRRETAKGLRLCRLYQSGVERLKGDWAGKGVSGEAF